MKQHLLISMNLVGTGQVRGEPRQEWVSKDNNLAAGHLDKALRRNFSPRPAILDRSPAKDFVRQRVKIGTWKGCWQAFCELLNEFCNHESLSPESHRVDGHKAFVSSPA